jgi:hypothetical protein
VTLAQKIRAFPGDDAAAAKHFDICLSEVRRIRTRRARRGRPPGDEGGPLLVRLPPVWDRRVRRLAKIQQISHSQALVQLLEGK